MIPPFKLYFYPFLLCLSNKKEVRLGVISLFVAQYFKLDKNDLSEMTKKGSSTKHLSRMNYCASYLKKLGLVKSNKTGIYSITNKGMSILIEKGDKLTRDDFKTLPEYINMQINLDNPDAVYIKEHYNKKGRLIPAYWCNINNISKDDREQVIKDTKEKLQSED